MKHNLVRIYFFKFLLIITFVCNDALHASNKENFSLCRENFSDQTTIDFKGLAKHFHYSFRDENILQQALYPLLPKKLKLAKTSFEQLEFLGDAVLGLIIRERILELFPQESLKKHNDFYAALTCNKTLAEIYQNTLKVERYLPYPEADICKYCDIIEALIGAIYKDAQNYGLAKACTFVSFIINDHVMQEKWQQINLATLNESDLNQTQNSIKTVSIFPASSSIETILKTLAKTRDIFHLNPKTLLTEVMSKSSQDQPEYYVTLGRNANNSPGFEAYVIGSKIGQSISGFGWTKIEAEEAAARNAINFLAGKDYLPQPTIKQDHTDYVRIMAEYCQLHPDISLIGSFLYLAEKRFRFIAYLEDNIIGIGIGYSKKEAQENAAHEAYNSLVKLNSHISPTIPASKNYRMVLNELMTQGKVHGLVFKDEHDEPSAQQIQCQVKLGDNTIAHTFGLTKDEAKQKAYAMVFTYFQTQQEASKLKFKKVEKKQLSHKKLGA